MFGRAAGGVRRRLGRPPPCPRGWRTGPPDFVGVGSQRSGSTWWFGLLRAHPGLSELARKELHFFDGFVDREFTDEDITAYHRFFPRPPGAVTGEWTPRYMHDPWAPGLLRRVAPEARILVSLRDPLVRFRSGLEHEQSVMKRELRGSRARHLRTMIVNDELQRSLYSVQLARLFTHFDREQVLVLQYERCVRDTIAELRRTYGFVGLDPEFVPELPPTPGATRGGSSRLPPHLTASAREVIEPDVAELSRLVPELDLELWSSVRGRSDPPYRIP